MVKKTKVSCIIPAFNEAKTIAGVVKTCLQTPEIGEIIVVNDGSTDKSLDKLALFGSQIKVINLPKNRGKGYAVAQGVKAAKFEILLFLDADLINFEPHLLSSIINPVIQQGVEMTIGVITPFKILHYPSFWQLSGQRYLPKKLILPHLKAIEPTRYGLELSLNRIFEKRKIAVVPLISHRSLYLIKSKKQKDWLKSYSKELWDLSRVTIRHKSAAYKKKFENEFIKSLSSYLKVSIEKIKQYLQE